MLGGGSTPGAIPGAPESFVMVKDAAKRKAPKELPFPAAIRNAAEASAPAEGEQQ